MARRSPSGLLVTLSAMGGALSYAFYLWHQQVIWALQGRLAGLAMLVAALVATLAVAAASWYLVERPGIRLGRRLARSERPSRPPLQGQLEAPVAQPA